MPRLLSGGMGPSMGLGMTGVMGSGMGLGVGTGMGPAMSGINVGMGPGMNAPYSGIHAPHTAPYTQFGNPPPHHMFPPGHGQSRTGAFGPDLLSGVSSGHSANSSNSSGAVLLKQQISVSSWTFQCVPLF
jgi:hypothetical protein